MSETTTPAIEGALEAFGRKLAAGDDESRKDATAIHNIARIRTWANNTRPLIERMAQESAEYIAPTIPMRTARSGYVSATVDDVASLHASLRLALGLIDSLIRSLDMSFASLSREAQPSPTGQPNPAHPKTLPGPPSGTATLPASGFPAGESDSSDRRRGSKRRSAKRPSKGRAKKHRT